MCASEAAVGFPGSSTKVKKQLNKNDPSNRKWINESNRCHTNKIRERFDELEGRSRSETIYAITRRERAARREVTVTASMTGPEDVDIVITRADLIGNLLCAHEIQGFCVAEV